MKVNLKKLNLGKILRVQNLGKKLIYGLVILLFIFANLFISYLPFRIDLSNGQAYTLSPATKKIVSNLKNNIDVKFYISSDLPTRLLPLKSQISDLLDEYKRASNGKIKLSFLDPKKSESISNEVKQLGIPELQFSQLDQDKYAVSTAYFGMGIFSGAKKEVIPQVTELQSFEYNLTSSIYKMTNKNEIVVGLVLNSENLQVDPTSSLQQLLSQQFTIVPVNFNQIESPQKLSTVLVFDDNKTSYTNEQIQFMKTYLKAGGKIIFFVDGVGIGENLTTQSATHGLFSLLNDYGLKLNTNFVLSNSAELVNFGNAQYQLVVPYPFWVHATQLNHELSYFANIRQLSFPWTSSITTNNKNGMKILELVKSSDTSWEQINNYVLNPQAVPQPSQQQLKTFIIGAQSVSNKGTVVLIPSSRFVLDQFSSTQSDNLNFVLNLVNDLASSGALSGIRSRAALFYPLPNVSGNSKEIFKYLNILLLPGLFAAYGILRFMKKK